MKVRWAKNSLRLRITPAELASLEQGDLVREEMCLPGSDAAGWGVLIQPGASETSIQMQGCSVMLQLGDRDRACLQETDIEGVYFEREAFRYYIEKDFPCVHPRAGDAMEAPTETFPNPERFADRE